MTDKTTDHQSPEAFAALGVRPSILRALGEEKFITPSVIQNMLIPKALAGYDILGQARTGTGKTAAFGIPILQQCQREGATQALILVPTRELAMQVDTEIKRIAKYTPIRTVPVLSPCAKSMPTRGIETDRKKKRSPAPNEVCRSRFGSKPGRTASCLSRTTTRPPRARS